VGLQAISSPPRIGDLHSDSRKRKAPGAGYGRSCQGPHAPCVCVVAQNQSKKTAAQNHNPKKKKPNADGLTPAHPRLQGSGTGCMRFHEEMSERFPPANVLFSLTASSTAPPIWTRGGAGGRRMWAGLVRLAHSHFKAGRSVRRL
jgi:hypothetical protein